MNVISSLTAQIQDLPKVFAVSQRYFVGTYDMLFKLLKFLCKSGDYQITGKNKKCCWSRDSKSKYTTKGNTC